MKSTGTQAATSDVLLRAALASVGLCCALAACAPAAPPPVMAHAAPRPGAAASPPDWFHHELALARHARVAFVPQGDQAGAQLAYYKVMVPACHHVMKSGPDKYRGRCGALLHHATMAEAADAAKILPPPDDFACNDDRDDSNDPTAQVTACSD
jgi:hypothetical protein